MMIVAAASLCSRLVSKLYFPAEYVRPRSWCMQVRFVDVAGTELFCWSVL
jgi:hypothetical protein